MKNQHFVSVLVLGGCLFATSVLAAWNAPTCNPDAADGPTAAACNVSAPLNVSAADQIKTGAITVENTVAAEDVVISAGATGSGTLGVTSNTIGGSTVSIDASSYTNAGTALNITTTGTGVGVIRGVSVDANGTNSFGVSVASDNVGLQVTSALTGLDIDATNSGVDVTATSGPAGTFVSNAGSTAGAVRITNNTANGAGLDVRGGGGIDPATLTLPSGGPANLGIGIRATGSLSYGVVGSTTSTNGLASGVLGLGSTGFGLFGQSSANYGVYGNSTDSSTYYGGAFCNNSVNCAFLGGPVYSASLSQTYIEDALSSSSGRVLEVNNTSGSGVAILGNTEGDGYGVSATADIGDGGSGLFAHGDTGAKIWGETTVAAEIFGRNDAQGLDVITQGAGIGVEITAQGSGSGLVIDTQSGVGIDITSASGTGLAVSTTNNPAITATVVGINPAGTFNAAAGIGIDVSSVSNTGVNITVANDQSAINTTGGQINHPGPIFGGQFYPASYDSNGVYPNAEPHIADYNLLAYTSQKLVFDGSDIWVGHRTDRHVSQLNAVDARLAQDISTTVNVNPAVLLMVDDDLFVFDDNSGYLDIINKYDEGSSPAINTGFTGTLYTAYYNGETVLTGGAGHITSFNPTSKTFNTSNSILSVSEVRDITYANGVFWAVDTGNDEIIKTNGTGANLSEIAVGDQPYSIVFDGYYLWVSNYGDDTLTRIDPNSEVTETYDISSIGSGPRQLAFDGVNLWMTLYDTSEVGWFNVSTQEPAGDLTLLGPTPQDLVFDGTSVWVTTGSDKYVIKIATGAGDGYGAVPVSRGIYLVDQTTGTIYCYYVDNGTRNLGTASDCR